MKKNVVIGFWVFLLFLLPISQVFAAEYSVRPFLVDVSAQPRDVITETILLTNDSTSRKYVVYATVNEVSLDTSDEIKEFISPVMTDRTNTVTSWIEITRGRIEIPPGEKKEIPLTLRINPNAEPGEYQAFVGFVPASNRPAAEAIAMNDEADGVIVKITIADKREDNMRISSFIVDRFVTGDDSRTINIEVENIGDLPSAPKGEIIFYDSHGIEVTSIPVNTQGEVIAPGDSVILKSSVPLDNSLGRFKANVSLQYGENQSAALFDTAFFYMMPMHLLLLVFGVILFIAIVVALLFRRSFLNEYQDDDGDEVMMYVRDGHDAKPQDHDIDLKNTTKE